MADKMLNAFDIWITAQGVKSRTRLRSVDNISLEGIARLRELILDLAVRGKLVKQNAQDELASSLLIKIAQEKKIRSKADRKTPSILDISMDEVLFDLPKGWAWTRNAFLFSLRKGKKPKTISSEKIGLPYLDIAALDRGEIDKFTDDLTCPTATQDDILVVCDGSRSGLILNGQKGVVGSTIAIIETVPFLKNYIRLLFSKAYNELNSTMKGAAIPHLDTNRLLNSVIGLPPLAEQHRIVAKVEELMALCDELEKQEKHHLKSHALLVETLLGTLTQAKDANEFQQAWSILAKHFDDLFSTEESIDQLKQTILQLAVMGKLVPQDPNDEPASELLKKIKPEMIKVSTKGSGKNVKSGTPSSEVVPPIVLPKGWACCDLDDLVDLNSGVTLGKSYKEKTVLVPYLRVANVQRGFVDTSDVKKIAVPKAEILKYQLNKGDLLMIEGGDWDKVGRCAIWGGEITPCIHQNHIFRLRLNSKLSNRFVERYLNSPVARKYFESYSKQTTNLASINKTQLKSTPVLVPPRNEQGRIVMIIDELFALCDGLKARIKESQKAVNLMAHSILEHV